MPTTYLTGKGRFTGYRIGNDGTIWSRRRRGSNALGPVWRKLKGGRSSGYAVIHIAGKTWTVHSLVLTAFVGPRPVGMECCHANGVRDDNRLRNLRWDTRRANLEDRIKQGRTRLKKEQVREIRESLSAGTGIKKTARRFGVSPRTVREIKSGRTWSWMK